ncbi:MAG: glycosyltransferase [Lachnospiraceae bacterium]|nr:glycosyltransferase [Lachnospiraceae bacterium]
MEIQKILFPQIGRCTEKELYFRLDRSEQGLREEVKTQYSYEHQIIEFDRRGKVWFDTYFNGLTIEKWLKYTAVKEVSLKVKISGKFKVILINKERINTDIFEKTLCEQIIESDVPGEFILQYKDGSGKGMYTFGLEALEDDSKYYGGAYIADIDEKDIRNVKVGIGICTFKREAFIEKNIRILNETILENEQSPLFSHLEIFIADNGKTLDVGRLQSDNIHIYPNRNLGGAGGFTRDMIEMIQNNDKYQVTHVLLMDDDVVIEPEALVKTYILLSLIKDEYTEAFIGGAMLRIDQQYQQVESGAVWNGGNLNSLKRGLDLRLCDECLYNEVEEYSEFNAWWYCCFPIEIVRDDNLPLPIFIRGDDLEYGLRNMKKLILMNGICVWHEPFDYKYSSFLEYYIMRNQLIDNSFHCQWYGKKQLNKTMFKHCVQEIMFYRYKNVDLYLQGIKDFLKGPKWLMEQDGEVLHKKIMSVGYKGQDLEELPMGLNYPVYEKSLKKYNTIITNIKRNLSFNGLFLPSKGENVVSMSAAKTSQFYRKKRVMHYDAAGKKAFITERSLGKSMKYLAKTIAMLFVISFKLTKAQQAYREDGLELRTLEFWKGYLEI